MCFRNSEWLKLFHYVIILWKEFDLKFVGHGLHENKTILKKIRYINTVGVTFINVSVIASAMCSLICLETKIKFIPVAAV